MQLVVFVLLASILFFVSVSVSADRCSYIDETGSPRYFDCAGSCCGSYHRRYCCNYVNVGGVIGGVVTFLVVVGIVTAIISCWCCACCRTSPLYTRLVSRDVPNYESRTIIDTPSIVISTAGDEEHQGTTTLVITEESPEVFLEEEISPTEDVEVIVSTSGQDGVVAVSDIPSVDVEVVSQYTEDLITFTEEPVSEQRQRSVAAEFIGPSGDVTIETALLGNEETTVNFTDEINHGVNIIVEPASVEDDVVETVETVIITDLDADIDNEQTETVIVPLVEGTTFAEHSVDEMTVPGVTFEAGSSHRGSILEEDTQFVVNVAGPADDSAFIAIQTTDLDEEEEEEELVIEEVATVETSYLGEEEVIIEQERPLSDSAIDIVTVRDETDVVASPVLDVDLEGIVEEEGIQVIDDPDNENVDIIVDQENIEVIDDITVERSDANDMSRTSVDLDVNPETGKDLFGEVMSDLGLANAVTMHGVDVNKHEMADKSDTDSPSSSSSSRSSSVSFPDV